MMTPLAYALSALSCVLALGLVASMRAWLRVSVQVLRLNRSITRLKLERDEYKALSVDYAHRRDEAVAAVIGPLKLDAKTVGLIRLATSNPERNEAASSALAVCERLKKRLV